MPVLKMVIDMIGGPIVGLKPYVEGVFDVVIELIRIAYRCLVLGGISIGTETKCAEHNNPAISAFLNAGFAVRYANN